MRYGLLHNLLPIDTCILSTMQMFADKNAIYGDGQVDIAKTFYTVPYLEVLLPIIKPKMEEFWGKEFIPTYVYSRILFPGSELEPHKDRESCEYSVTVTLAHNYPEDFQYPIYMEGTPINIPIGSGATYLGCEVEHWREPLIGSPSNYWTQAFFHYVDANGPFAEWAWDKRHLTIQS